MKFAAKTSLALIVFTAPVAAHTDAHLHVHATDNLLIGLGVMAIAAVAATVGLRK